MSVGNSIEKPRWFIDLLNYQYQIGNVGTIGADYWEIGEKHPYTIGLSPTRMYESYTQTEGNDYIYFKIGFKNTITIPDADMFVSVLGHNWASEGYTFGVQFHIGGTEGSAWLDATDNTEYHTINDIVNRDCEYDGWSMGKFTPEQTENISAIVFKISNVNSGETYKLGGVALGSIYEPEFNADLGVSQSRIMDGIKNKQTKGGKTYSIINYTRPSDWWNGSPFELTDPSLLSPPVAFSNARMGRRSWDVGFSQLTDRKYTDGVPNGVFPVNDMVNRHLPDTVNGNYSSDQDYDSETLKFNYNINNDISLYSTVYHHTLGGTLAFLFSPSSDNSPQNFAICRFAKPGFKVTEKSYKKLNIKMKINESW